MKRFYIESEEELKILKRAVFLYLKKEQTPKFQMQIIAVYHHLNDVLNGNVRGYQRGPKNKGHNPQTKED